MKRLKITIVATVMLILVSTISLAGENILGSSRFSKDDGWISLVLKDAQTAGSCCEFVDGILNIKAIATEKELHRSYIQILKNVEMTAGKNYKVTLKINSNKEGVLPILYTLRDAPYSLYASADIKFDASEQVYTCILPVNTKASEEDRIKCIRICAGALRDTELSLSDISIEELME